MLRALTLLLVFQLAGEVLVRAAGWPVPGPVLGMALLFILLVLRGGADAPLQHTSANLLRLLPLFFVPAGVGVIVHLQRLKDEWLPITVSLVVSTVLALIVTGFSLHWLARKARA